VEPSLFLSTSQFHYFQQNQTISPNMVSKTNSKVAPGRATDSKKTPPRKTPSVGPKSGAPVVGSGSKSGKKVQAKLNLTPSPQTGDKATVPPVAVRASTSPVPGFSYAAAASSPPRKVPSPPVQVAVKASSAAKGVETKTKLLALAKETANGKATPPSPADSVPGTVMGSSPGKDAMASNQEVNKGGSSLARSAAASYRSKVKTGVLQTDQAARGEAKKNGYGNWTPLPPPQQPGADEDIISISSTDLTLSSVPSPPRTAAAAKPKTVFREVKPEVCPSSPSAGQQGRQLHFDSSSGSGLEGSGDIASSGRGKEGKAPPEVIELLASSSEDLSVSVSSPPRKKSLKGAGVNKAKESESSADYQLDDLSEESSLPDPFCKSPKRAEVVNKAYERDSLKDHLSDDLSEGSSLPDPLCNSPKRAEVAAVNEARRYMKDSFQQCMMEAEEEVCEEMTEDEQQNPPKDKGGQGGVHFAGSTKAPAEEKEKVQYSPQVTGGAFFRPQTPLFNSSNPSNSSAGLQQGFGHQGYTLVADSDTVAYFSGRDIISKIAHIHRTAEDKLVSLAHHSFSPFRLQFQGDTTVLEILNCNGDLIGIMGTQPCLHLPDSERYVPVTDYTFQDNAFHSYHYPTYVLAQALQVKLSEAGNDPQHGAHPNSGPFRVQVDSGRLSILNRDSQKLVELPLPEDAVDAKTPWLQRKSPDHLGATSGVAAGPGDVAMDVDGQAEKRLRCDPGDESSKPPGVDNARTSRPPPRPKQPTPNTKKRQSFLSFSRSPTQATAAPPVTQSAVPPAVSPTVTPGNRPSCPTDSPSIPPPSAAAPAIVSPAAHGQGDSPTRVAGSALRTSSFAMPAHNPLPEIAHEMEPINLGDCPMNEKGLPLIVMLVVSPVEGQHPLEYVYAGVYRFLSVAARFDSKVRLLPILPGNLREVTAAPDDFIKDYDHLQGYLEVDPDQLKRVQGNDRRGRKRQQGKAFCALRINSNIDPRFLVEKIAPSLDRIGLSLTTKKLQQISTTTPFAFCAASSQTCPTGTAWVLRQCLEEELRRAPPNSPLSDVDEVPEFCITMKPLRLNYTANRRDNNNLEHFQTALRRAPAMECSVRDEVALTKLVNAAERSEIFRKMFSAKVHAKHAKERSSCNSKVEASMAYNANTVTVNAWDIDHMKLYRKVKIVMAPAADGSVPPVPKKYASLHSELTSFKDGEGRQLIDALIPVMEGHDEGATTVVFRQTEEAERFALSFARDPCVFLFHLCTKVLGYREDMVLTLCQGFTLVARGRISDSTWDPETWTATSTNTTIADTFVDDLMDEGYRLGEEFLTDMPVVNSLIADKDMERVVANLGLPDDATAATRDGMSVAGATHATMGDSSVRSENTQDFRRNLDARYIAQAQAQEKAAAARWGTPMTKTPGPVGTGAMAPGFTPPPSTPNHSPHPHPPNSSTVSSDSHTMTPVGPPREASTTGEPASIKQSGPGYDPFNSNMGEGAEGPQGSR
jgi:hypothetical protein